MQSEVGVTQPQAEKLEEAGKDSSPEPLEEVQTPANTLSSNF